jgi:hypothetical protein
VPPLYLHLFYGPKLIATAQVLLSKPFKAGTLKGLIQARGVKFFANVTGDCEGTGSFLQSEIELEKPVLPTTLAFSGFGCLGEFVLSTNSDCTQFLERQWRQARVFLEQQRLRLRFNPKPRTSPARATLPTPTQPQPALTQRSGKKLPGRSRTIKNRGGRTAAATHAPGS